MEKLRAGIVGLGWMGWLYDVATRPPVELGPTGTTRGMPPLRPDRDPPPYGHPGQEGLTATYAGAFVAHPLTELVAGCEPNDERRVAFGERYGVTALYADYREMLRRERLDIVAVASHAALRPEIVELAIECGARAIITEKPMAHSLEDADRMVAACERVGAPLVCGAICVNHPAFARAKALIEGGAIGRLLSLDADQAFAQHNPWMYMVDSPAEWVIGVRSETAAARADGEFAGSGLIRFASGVTGHIRPGAPFMRLTDESGEITFDWRNFRLWQDNAGPGGTARLEVPWGEPQVLGAWSPLYGVADLIDCLEHGGEPRVSGRRVRQAMEIEIALRESHQGGNVKVALPLADGSLRMSYDWFR